MTELKAMWQDAGSRTKAGLAFGVLLIAVVTGGLAFWVFGQEYQTLYANVNGQDAAAMVAELDRLKVPYKLTNNGNTIEVPKDLVYKTRLKLMGKNLPLHGTVGLEIFNNTDLGGNENTHKVNYLRALQGELTRTIMAYDEVQSVRVHLALPDVGLFKKAQSRGKASVSLVMKTGAALSREQIQGIQRLVAASVPEIEATDVTVLDHRGVALSGNPAATGREEANWQLETKQQVENYFVRKIAGMLEKTFGAGQGIVTVDVLLNLDHIKVTTEDVLPAKGKGNEPSAAGVIARERQTVRDLPIGRDAGVLAEALKGQAGQSGVTNLEVDYQSGRRIEQVVATPGSIRRISVGVVVPKGLDQARLEKIREVVAMASGYNGERGDAIAVYSLDQLSGLAAEPVGAEAPAAKTQTVPGPSAVVESEGGSSLSYNSVLVAAVALIAAALVFLARRRSQQPLENQPALLSEEERQRMLIHVRRWLDTPQLPSSQGEQA